MTVEPVGEASDELVTAFARLIPQLSPQRPPPSAEELAALVAEPGTTVFVARDGSGAIVGTLTLVVYGIPTGRRGLIEDVVVDEAARGRGVGEELVRAALDAAVALGAHTVSLTSRPEREAANRLYARLGFDRRETNVYVWRPR